MKKVIFLISLCLFFIFSPVVDARVSVKGYYRKDGTYVKPHYRSDPDGIPYNNYSYPGNYNPNTGEISGGSVDTYLKNYNKYSSNYSYTPTCPSMSSYNSVSGKCECYSGYIVGTDVLGRQACVSADSKCSDDYGYGAQYNSANNQCECKSGYVFNNKKCVSTNEYCNNLVGLMSLYNSVTGKCECMTGYALMNSTCTKKILIYCPENSYKNLNGGCSCNSGFEVNSNKNGCIKSCSSNEIMVSDLCVCESGFIKNSSGDGCIKKINVEEKDIKTGDTLCKESYGQNVYSDNILNSEGKYNCYCSDGYKWDKNVCIKIDKNANNKKINKIIVKTKENVTLRKEPSSDSKKIGSAKKGSEYEVTDLSNVSWIKIKIGNIEGYVLKKYVIIK